MIHHLIYWCSLPDLKRVAQNLHVGRRETDTAVRRRPVADHPILK